MRALRLSVLLALVLALIPAPAGAQDLDVSFEVVEETPVSVTIRVTISGATAPIQATARVDDYHGTPSPPVQGITLSQVERVARYQHKPETETVLVPIDEKIATLTAEVDSLEKAPIAKGEDTLLRKEAIDEKDAELTTLSEAKDLGATHVPQEVVTSHTYTLEYREQQRVLSVSREGDTLLLPTQSWADPPPDRLVSDSELSLEPVTVNWNGDMVYEYTIATGDARTADGGYGSAGILVLTINGQDYYDDTNSSWWANEWPYRMKLTIDNSASTEDLIDFPMLVKLTPERFDYSLAQIDGDDIRFVDADDTKALHYELDTWDRTGESFFWVQVPQIDAGSTEDYIWMYFGSPTVGNGENAEVVWENGYEAVYHMNDSPTDSTKILDSTANGNTGTKGAGAAAPTEVVGTVGMAQQFVAANGQYIDCGNGNSVKNLSVALTVMHFSSSPAIPTDQSSIVSKGIPNKAGGSWYFDGIAGTRRGYWQVRNAANDATATAPYANAWSATEPFVHTWVFDGPSTTMSVFLNGALDVTKTDVPFNALCVSNSPLLIGKVLYSTGRFMDAVTDELRLSSVARSAEWIEAEYLSMWDSMLTYGDTEDYVPEPEPAEETLPTLVQSLVLVFIVGLAQRQRDPILYLVAALTVVFIGYTLISYSLMWSWLVAVAIYLAYRAVLGMWGMARA